jgi:hypothetical protein
LRLLASGDRRRADVASRRRKDLESELNGVGANAIVGTDHHQVGNQLAKHERAREMDRVERAHRLDGEAVLRISKISSPEVSLTSHRSTALVSA